MEKDSRDMSGASPDFLGAGWFDPIEVAIRDRVRGFIEELVEAELDEALGRSRYQRARGRRGGEAEQPAIGMDGGTPVARFVRPGDDQRAASTTEQRRRDEPGMAQRSAATLCADDEAGGGADRGRLSVRHQHAPGAAGTGSAVQGRGRKDIVSRTWRKVQTDWEAWCRRSLAEEDVVRLILDGTVVRVRLDRKATSISLLVVLGIRRDGQKVLLAVRNMGGESEAAWRSLLDDLIGRGLSGAELRHHRRCGGAGEGARPGVA